MNLQQFVQYAQENGGGSLHLPSGNINPTNGYMVSIKGAESKMSLSLDNAIFFCTKHIERLMLNGNKDTYFGMWLKDGTWYYDVSINMDDRDSAIAFGKANEQIAIWDCALGDEIVLDYEEVDLYPRKCSVTGKGMAEGWVFDNGEKYAIDKKSATTIAKNYGYANYKEAYNDHICYWTEWDTDLNEDDNDEMWDADGNLYTWVDGKPTRYVEPTPEVIDLRKNVRSHHQYAVTFTREYTTTINVTSEDEASAIVMAHDTLAEQEMEQMNVDITNISIKKRFNLVKG